VKSKYLFILFAFFMSSANAAYIWQNQHDGISYGSATAACDVLKPPNAGDVVYTSRLTMSSDSVGFCEILANGVVASSSSVSRSGDAPSCTQGEAGSGTSYKGMATGPDYVPPPGSGSAYCDGSCVVAPTTGFSCTAHFPGAVAVWPSPMWCSGTGTKTGGTCSFDGNNPPVPAPSTAPDPTPPPCAPGQGVMTTSTGKVVCVPPGTPGETNPPKVTKTESTKTHGDGSSTTTTTTQTCTGAGSCSSTTTTTTTGVGGATGAGATPGQAGTPGVSNETQDKQGESFCAQNPSLQVCKGGMNEEATQKSIEAELKKLTSPTDPSDISQGSKDAITAQLDGQKSAIDGVASSGLANHGVIFGWQSPELTASCSPWQFHVGGFDQTIDACPTIFKIRDISGYVLYFLTAMTLGWILFAGGKQA